MTLQLVVAESHNIERSQRCYAWSEATTEDCFLKATKLFNLAIELLYKQRLQALLLLHDYSVGIIVVYIFSDTIYRIRSP